MFIGSYPVSTGSKVGLSRGHSRGLSLLFSEMSLQLQQQPIWMCWQQQQLLKTHHHHSSEVVRFLLCFCIVTNFINCLLILIRIHVLAIVGSDNFVCLALYSCTSHFGYIKSYSVYIYRLLHIIFCASTLFNCFCLQLNN